ncbi:MAG: hypothetical protein E6Q98_15850 [Rhodospirillaceae bacterium]|nr:MAG: hypothetical protein E6Q98_15850 [Rhodospirillaceae bacterium]
MTSYATDGKCHNAEPGSFGHECGKPATWIGGKPDGFRSGFCDHCKDHGSEARFFEDWKRIDQRRVAVTNLLTSIDQLKAAFGAPGDYGYGTREGKALFSVYQAAAAFKTIATTPQEHHQNELREALKACRVENLLVQAGSLTLLRNALVANNQRIDAAIAKAEGHANG